MKLMRVSIAFSLSCMFTIAGCAAPSAQPGALAEHARVSPTATVVPNPSATGEERVSMGSSVVLKHLSDAERKQVDPKYTAVAFSEAALAPPKDAKRIQSIDLSVLLPITLSQVESSAPPEYTLFYAYDEQDILHLYAYGEAYESYLVNREGEEPVLFQSDTPIANSGAMHEITAVPIYEGAASPLEFVFSDMSYDVYN